MTALLLYFALVCNTFFRQRGADKDKCTFQVWQNIADCSRSAKTTDVIQYEQR